MAMPAVRWRVGLPLKFILSISLLIAVTSISLGVFFVRHDVALVTAELLERGRSLVRALIQQEDVLYVVIHDATGAVLAAGKAEQLRAIPSAGTPRRPWTEREW